VHALRNVHRMLRSEGLLLDSRPLADGARVEAGGRTLGRLDEREFARELVVLDRAVEGLVAEALFRPVDERVFEVAMDFDGPAELLSEVVTWRGIAVPVRLQRAVKRGEPPFEVRITTAVRVYEKGSTASPTRMRPGSTTSP
jgi:hypothetical protein